jgi:hypothetical protein
MFNRHIIAWAWYASESVAFVFENTISYGENLKIGRVTRGIASKIDP